ncbi:FadR/GntR family transcriptional regulator [Pararhizobium mangrovi]|uniref:FadR family transcriptional regulator n=1 Tax=Pararhizobium mangrovi TaxID=2590452 RepID=A0A506UCF6_9HYPH|nr:FadR/GntR family transcriptional regulator [Pararhizobium mangrovi]TPW30349.1 FadR family transcriptional regulator [Pararhizobium mangrovi]
MPDELENGLAHGGDRPDTKNLHRDVVDIIARRVLTGEYRENETIPGLENLAEQLGTSRTTVREAVRVLSAKGFVDSRRRAGTRVNPRSQWNLLDRDVLAWLLDENIAHDISEDLLVLRRIIEPSAAMLAAQNASARQLAEIEDAFHRMRASLPDDIDGCCQADVDFHMALLAASGNAFLEQLAHTIRSALLVTFELTTRLAQSHSETLWLHEALVENVRKRDATAAGATMTDLLAKAERDLGSGAPEA